MSYKELNSYRETRFSDGMWQLREDVNIHWAAETFKVHNVGDKAIEALFVRCEFKLY
jgi:hypothetical protein